MADWPDWPDHLNLLRETHSWETHGIVAFELIEDEQRSGFEKHPESYQVATYLSLSKVRERLLSDEVVRDVYAGGPYGNALVDDGITPLTAELSESVYRAVISAALAASFPEEDSGGDED